MPDSYSRRHFLKLSAALLAGGAAIAAAPDARGMGFSGVPDVGPVTEMKGYCPFCQVRCTYRARVSGGKVLSLTGEKGNYWTGGAMCPKGMSIVELIGSPYRITEPMRRKENGEWERVTYAQAVDMVAERMAEVIKKHGKAAANRVGMTMPLWDCRESEIAALMTLRIAGSVHAMPPGESCVSSASNMLGMMIGVNSGSTKVDELLNTKTIVLWGANVCDLYPPYSRWLEMAREKGVKIVYLDPRRTRTSLLADMQLRPLPGTDGVLAIGAIRYMLETGAYDEERARFQIEGFDELAAETESFTVEKVASATGLSPEAITAFYGTLAQSPRTVVWLGGSLSRYSNGIIGLRAIILLQALCDNLIGEGKGILTFQSGKPEGDDEFVDHFFGETKTPKMNFRRLRNAMEKGTLDILFLNSSYRRYPDSKGVRKAIDKVPFVVHCGFFLTEETEAADLFVPATFGPESQGSGYGNEQQVVWREKMVQAPGSCAPSWQFYRDVGRKLNPGRYPDFKDPEDSVPPLLGACPFMEGDDPRAPAGIPRRSGVAPLFIGGQGTDGQRVRGRETAHAVRQDEGSGYPLRALPPVGLSQGQPAGQGPLRRLSAGPHAGQAAVALAADADKLFQGRRTVLERAFHLPAPRDGAGARTGAGGSGHAGDVRGRHRGLGGHYGKRPARNHLHAVELQRHHAAAGEPERAHQQHTPQLLGPHFLPAQRRRLPAAQAGVRASMTA